MVSFLACRIGSSPGLGVAFALATCAALACRTKAEPELEKQQAPPAAAVERLQFALPAAFAPLELRGEGSETLHAPPGATVRVHSARVEVEAGDDFALEIDLQPERSQLPEPPQGARRVQQESDLAVFEAGGGYWFVSSRELVPEWDESARRRVLCSSAGAVQGPAASAEPRRFPRAAVERMVAACRSLALPRLD